MVRSMRHFRGDTGEVLNTRAVQWVSHMCSSPMAAVWASPTLLEDRCAVHLDHGAVILVLLVIGHDCASISSPAGASYVVQKRKCNKIAGVRIPLAR